MLGQVELGQSTPTINVLWKIARALGVPFSALITNRAAGRTTVMPATRAKVLTSHDGAFSSRALFPFDEPRTVEFYELRLAPRSVERADAHPPGTVENLVVQRRRARARRRRRAPPARDGRRDPLRGRRPARVPEPGGHGVRDVPRDDVHEKSA